jgi:uncharacterized protein
MSDSPATLPAKPWGLWATLGLSLVVLVVFLTIQMLAAAAVLTFQSTPNFAINVDVIITEITSNGFVLAIATIIAAPIGTALVIWLIRLRNRSVQEYLSLRKPTSEELLKWLLITIMYIVAVDLLKFLFDRPVMSPFMSEILQTADILPALYLALVILIPIFEEVFFRGFLFKGIRYSKLRTQGAIVLPAAIWAMLHLQYLWYDIVGIFVFGLLLGMAQLRTGSLYVPIAMHMLNNFLAVIQVSLH